jgi:hypothetical protein
MTPAQFAAELQRVSAGAEKAVAPAVKKGALNVKNNARASLSSSNAGKQAAGAHINFDMLGTLDAEIGYDKPAGALGTMNEYGSAGNAPKRNLGNALEREAPVLEKYVGEAVDGLWR